MPLFGTIFGVLRTCLWVLATRRRCKHQFQAVIGYEDRVSQQNSVSYRMSFLIKCRVCWKSSVVGISIKKENRMYSKEVFPEV